MKSKNVLSWGARACWAVATGLSVASGYEKDKAISLKERIGSWFFVGAGAVLFVAADVLRRFTPRAQSVPLLIENGVHVVGGQTAAAPLEQNTSLTTLEKCGLATAAVGLGGVAVACAALPPLFAVGGNAIAQLGTPGGAAVGPALSYLGLEGTGRAWGFMMNEGVN